MVRMLLCVELTSRRLGLGVVKFESLMEVFIIELPYMELSSLIVGISVSLTRPKPEPGIIMVPTTNLTASQLELTAMFPTENRLCSTKISKALQEPTRHA